MHWRSKCLAQVAGLIYINLHFLSMLYFSHFRHCSPLQQSFPKYFAQVFPLDFNCGKKNLWKRPIVTYVAPYFRYEFTRVYRSMAQSSPDHILRTSLAKGHYQGSHPNFSDNPTLARVLPAVTLSVPMVWWQILTICDKLIWFYWNVVLVYMIFFITPDEIFSHMGYLTVNKMVVHWAIDDGVIFLFLWKEIRLYLRYKGSEQVWM